LARISLRGVAKQYGATPVLVDCNLDIQDREFAVLVGPSGSGKTTLLRIIAGLEQLSAGELYFDDVCVNDVDVGERDIAMVFQNYGLYPHMTVYNNMAFGLRRRRMPRQDIDQRVRRAATMLNIEPFLTRLPKQLSGGQRQRVALGRAIVRNPSVFLLDEPLSNLDAHLRVQMRAEILKVHRAVGATAVYVTHDQVEALTMGDRIVVMNNGRIHQVGTPDELYETPVDKFVASFIGSPPMGFLSGEIEPASDTLAITTRSARIPLVETQARTLKTSNCKRVTVGIRPEWLTLATADRVPEEGIVINGKVEAIEVLGSEQYLHLDVDGQSLTARLPRERHLKAEQLVRMIAPIRLVHLFDHESGAALR
jgi:multiple sugar transport system ATP-binding protein